jgi:hypothetical protein
MQRCARCQRPLRRTADSWSLNAATTPVDEARRYAKQKLGQAGIHLDEAFSDFERNYLLLQDKLDKALDFPRHKMPVIEPDQIDEFQEDLRAGHVDIFKPWAEGHLVTPDGFSSRDEIEEWVTLGVQDGKMKDDVVNAKLTSKPCRALFPTQDQIWFDKLIQNVVDFGIVDSSSPVLDMTIIVSEDNYVLDGHHRWSGALLGDPSLSMDVLDVPMGINRLVEISRTYGFALGNEPKH